MRTRTRAETRADQRRGAALYVTVMSVALIVSVLGLAGLTRLGIKRHRMQAGSDLTLARTNAVSAVHLALQVLADDPNWRTTYTNGVESTPLAIGPADSGTVSWILEDTDGSLTDGDTDLRLKGIGRIGNVVQVASVKVTATGEALNCLAVAMCTGGLLEFFSSSTLTADNVVASNGDISTNSGVTINANVEAVGTISGSGYMGTTTAGVSARTLPSASVFDHYVANGTVISIGALPKSAGYYVMSDVVLSPNSNPFGATNPSGIYIIDCGGAKLRIKNSRLIATLVVINPSFSSRVEESVNWEPAVANYPALLVKDGNFRLDTSGTLLDEAALGVNFNPPGSPYAGTSDGDMTDTYPSVIKGLVYSAAKFYVGGDPQITGTVISGDTTPVYSGNSLTINYDSQYFSNPPPGFTQGQILKVTRGSWRWEPAP